MNKYIYTALIFSELSLASEHYAVAIAKVHSSRFHSQINSSQLKNPESIYIGMNISLRVENLQKIAGGKIPKTFTGLTTSTDNNLKKGDLIIVKYAFRNGKLQYSNFDYITELYCFDSKILENLVSNVEIHFEVKHAGGFVSCLNKFLLNVNDQKTDSGSPVGNAQ